MVLTQLRIRCRIAELASDAMNDEVRLSPKPGLVDSVDNGAHSDMDLSLFLRSSRVLEPYFREIADAAPLGEARLVLPLLRPIGLRGEELMFAETKGVNTHKGQIFSLGVCTAAAVRVSSAEDILPEAGRICQGLKAELVQSNRPTHKLTNGEKIFRDTGTTGIRGEAEEGFPSVRLYALPAYRKVRRRGGSREEAALESLLSLMSVVVDSNILNRRGWEGLGIMRSTSQAFLDAGGIGQNKSREKLKLMNEFFIGENLSPGGCADLLALTLFIAKMEEFYNG
jgi:triphosphoribosyl-dephospho-CoA synthase CitG